MAARRKTQPRASEAASAQPRLDRQGARRSESAADLGRLVQSLPGLDRRELLLQWRNHLGRLPPAHLPTWLLMRVLAYRLQVVAFGDLDLKLLRRLKGAEATETTEPVRFANRSPATRDGADLRPGAMLAREWRGKLERVTVLEDGFAWNGKTYRSLSVIAKAITGTSWNGHRFFGLRSGRSSAVRAAVSDRRGSRRDGADSPPMRLRHDARATEGAAPLRDLHPQVSDEGLEQDFNSLDAQREACEAYIKSQAHEGWILVRDRYDDGGLLRRLAWTGPALQTLLDDVRPGRIDIVVVYKVDRLTRSLADFAKLVELFDAHGVSFVSVTQAFNTTTSMGRLTLNVLLSFAQFEREVTGERIRDKIAASKKKGIWMGGVVPLGYRVENRALHVVEDHAVFVRELFRRYLEIGAVVPLKAALDRNNVRLPIRTDGTGRSAGGGLISRGHLYKILSNPIYVGRLSHKGQVYEGQHAAIIDRETWEKVQSQLASHAHPRADTNRASDSWLAGKLYDDRGSRMSPSEASRGGRRWRYYVSQAILQGRKSGRRLDRASRRAGDRGQGHRGRPRRPRTF